MEMQEEARGRNSIYRAKDWMIPLVLLGAMCMIAAQTYPMMYPGYDIWWHLDVIQSIDYFEDQPYGRWHWMWNKVFSWTSVEDIFERALYIHRTQFIISILLLYAASWLVIDALLKRTLGTAITALLSSIGVITWFLMHGTSSRTHLGGENSAAVLSWINWYSVSHQISLPLYVFAGAMLLHALLLPAELRLRKYIELSISALAIIGVGFIHAAEVPYYLFMMLVSLLVFSDRKQLMYLLLVGVPFFALVIFAFNHISHANSPLLDRILDGRWSDIFLAAQREGRVLVARLNRASTSWNGVYSLALYMTCILLLINRLKWPVKISERGVIWLSLSALMPAMLFQTLTAGILSQVTYLTLAWRFSFASFLFAVPSIYIGACIYMAKGGHALRAALMVSAAACTTIILWNDGQFLMVRKNADSLIAAFHKDRMHFGISQDHQLKVLRLAEAIRRSPPDASRCFDVFSTYYLYYVAKLHDICPTHRISESPSYLIHIEAMGEKGTEGGLCSCRSAKGTNTDPRFTSLLPDWEVRLLK